MKKPVIILLALFCLALAAPFINAGAQGNLYFTVVNDTMQDFNDETMPVKINDIYYLPLSVFNQYSLSTYTTYNRDRRVATIYSDNKSLSFEFGSGNTYDDKGKVYTFSAIYYNSGVYVPAVRTCQFFGFKFSVYGMPNMDNVEFLRIKNSNYTLSEDDIARLGAIKMQSMLNEYLASHYKPSPTPSSVPVTPTPSSNDDPPRYANVYICIKGIDEDTASILNSLDYYNYRACFFVTSDEIRQNPDLIRRIAGSGNSIGIICSQNIKEDYLKASALLREAANQKTIMIALSCENSSELSSTAQALGLIVWCDSNINVYGEGASSVTVKNKIASASGRLDLAFSSESASLFRYALGEIYSEEYTVKPINETVTTYLGLR